MNVTIPRAELLRIATTAANAAAKKSSIAVLVNVLLEAKDGCVTATGTDLYTGACVRTFATVDRAGFALVSADGLVKAVKGLPDGDVRVQSMDDGRVELSCGRSRQRLTTMASTDYPDLPWPSARTLAPVSADDLAAAIAGVVHASDTSDTHAHMVGVRIDIDADSIRCAATDGKVLAECTVKSGSAASVGALVPLRSIPEVRRALEASKGATVSVGVENGSFFVETETGIVSAKLTDAPFPAYQSLIPTKPKCRAVLDRDALVDLVKRVTSAVDRTAPVRVRIDEGALYMDATHDRGDAADVADAETDGSADLFMGAGYLTNAVAALPDGQVAIEVTDDRSPVLFVPASGRSMIQLVMPRKP